MSGFVLKPPSTCGLAQERKMSSAPRMDYRAIAIAFYAVVICLSTRIALADSPGPPKRQEPLERMDQPPVPGPLAPLGGPVRPRAVYSRNGFDSVQVNVDALGNNIFGDAANEPSIAVDPTNPDRIAIGWRQFDSVMSNFRQAGRAYSQDGGTTWTFPGSLQAGLFRSDPVLDSSADGVFYYYSLMNDFTCQLFRSFDGGVTWGPSIDAYGGDKAWMIVDKTEGPGRGNIYCAWSYVAACCGDDVFTRSTDGGLTFMTPITLPGLPIWGTLAVGPDGQVYVTGAASSSHAPVLRSLDAWDATVTPSFSYLASVNIGGSTVSGGTPNPGGLVGQMWIATGNARGANRDHVYLLGSVNPPGDDPLDVMFARSTNGGLSWNAPIRVNDDAPGTFAWQWFGTMSVAPFGRIDVVWNDTRADPTAIESELYYAFSVDGGVTFSANIPVSIPFNSHLGYPNQSKIGDYYDMVSDNYGASLAYAATFNGEQDVYYLRIENRDCNGNGVNDLDEIAAGTSLDCNTNGIPDQCEFDCNQNGVADDCDIASGTSNDCNLDSVPDECQLVGDDCNTNGVPDDCDVRGGTSPDCNSDGVPDECQLAGNDCDGNGVPDDCQTANLITQQPLSTNGCPGADVTFSVSAAGMSLSYAWTKGGTPLMDGADYLGTATPTLTVRNIDVADEGTYACAVTDGCLVADSAPATLSVIQLGEITTQPPATVNACAGGSALFTLTVAGGSPPPMYQWYEGAMPLVNGPDYTGVGTNELRVFNLTHADDGRTFKCVVFNECESVTSSESTLRVVSPIITVQPEDTCGEVGGTVVLAVAATSPLPVTYQWRLDTQVVGSGPMLELTGLQPEDAGEYRALAFTTSPVCITYSDYATVQVGDCPSCGSPGDADADGDVDLLDLQVFLDCFGRSVVDDPGCACANVDTSDWLVNMDDWTALANVLSGPM